MDCAETYWITPSGSGVVISTWYVAVPSINVIGAVKSHAPVATAVLSHPRRYVVSPFVT